MFVEEWLEQLIDLSKNDKTGHYLGCIRLDNYKGQDIFVTNMMLGSGGVSNYRRTRFRSTAKENQE